MKKDIAAWISTLALFTAVASSTRSDAQYVPTRHSPIVDEELSGPPDLTHYVRAAIPQDYAPGGKPALPLAPVSGLARFPSVFVVDAVVNNTDSDLKNTDTYGDSEPSIALNPISCVDRRGCRIIVLLAFSGQWTGNGTFSPLWLSTNWGETWTKEFTIPMPPNAPNGPSCPCDQTPDYGSTDQLSATFLTFGGDNNVYSGSTSNPADASAWSWLVENGDAQRTNQYGVNQVDQPWLLVNKDPEIRGQNNVYVDYVNFAGAPDMRTAVSDGRAPLDFTIDNLVGYSDTGDFDPGLRLAADPRSGALYSLFQQCVGSCTLGLNPKTINYVLNRSLDGGATWSLNGSSDGILVVTAQSTQARPKFGTVNALIGGVEHVTVDPKTGDVYVVYGDRDSSTGKNRLSIIRLTDNGSGGLTIGPSFFVTGQVQAALPSVAVADNSVGSVAVLYDTYDGMDSGYPEFSAHLAVSSDHGMTFQDVTMETFLSPATDNGGDRQRVLGDYQQLKSFANGFYGVFTGNGVPFHRPFSNTDPIFFKTFVAP